MTLTEYEQTTVDVVAEEIRSKYPHLNFYVHYEDIRYPSIIFNDNEDYPEYDNYVGYDYDWDKGDLGRRFCTCSAWDENECCCGAWDKEDE